MELRIESLGSFHSLLKLVDKALALQRIVECINLLFAVPLDGYSLVCDERTNLSGRVRRLDEELKRRDREAWVDWEGIPPGDTWEKTIYGAIEASHTFIFVLTPDSIVSEVCSKEIAHAAANNKRLVPIVHRDVVAERVPKSLGELNQTFFRDSDDFNKATDKLISALDTDLDWVHAHTRLLTRAIEWNANGKNTTNRDAGRSRECPCNCTSRPASCRSSA